MSGPGPSDPDDKVVANGKPKIRRWTGDQNPKTGEKDIAFAQ
jgi:hypothetical protein